MKVSYPLSLSAAEARDAIRRGELTSEALAAACLDRIAEREALIRAWVHLDPRFALDQARARDCERAEGAPLGPLHGVPVGVKDIIDTAESPTENGSPVFAGRRPKKDAAAVTALKAAGAVILGKTVTTELAFFSPGKTRNPANLDHTPGGSSSGSAAAVADFHVPLALGTQTAGSILRPASFCGVIGFKPTFGLLPREGVLEQSAPLDTIGGFARSVADIALLFACLCVDAMGSDPMAPAVGSFKDCATLGSNPTPRFAFVRSPAWALGEDGMKEAFARLVGSLGALVEEIELPPAFTAGLEGQRTVQFHDIAKNYGRHLEAHPGRISPKLADVIVEGRKISEAQYEGALALREALYGEFAPVFDGYDAILTPASAGPPPRGLASTGTPAFNALWTFLGVPAISLPLLEANGLPLGVQAVAERRRDRELLEVAQWLEARLNAEA